MAGPSARPSVRPADRDARRRRPAAELPVPNQRARLTRISRAGAGEVARILDLAAHEPGREASPRVRGLLAVTNDILADLTLPGVLHRIVQAACELVQAQYGALGILGGDGGLEEFITAGVDEAQAAAIGDPPEGRGLLGLLISDPRPLRLQDLGAHPQSVGFPPGHPPMRSFLGVPIQLQDRTYGNLYLAEKIGAPAFSAEDEELLTALSRAAAVAMDNARLYDLQHRRQAWSAASAEITRALLTGAPDPLAMIAARARVVAQAELARILIPAPDHPDLLVVAAADGPGAGHFVGMLVPKEGSLTGKALTEGRDLILDHASAGGVYVPPGVPLGPTLVGRAPSTAAGEPAVLALSRRPQDPRFDAEDLAMVVAFADQAGLAVELGRAQQERRQLLLADRDRIARDLHDHVIQRLFAAGLGLSSLASRITDPNLAHQLGTVTDAMDDTIRVLRHSIFDLRHAASADGLRAQIQAILDELTPALRATPVVHLRGPLDASLDPETSVHLLAVVREALTNTARHAAATKVVVEVAVTDGRELAVTIADDGVGLGAATRRSGLANLARRAASLGGTSRVSSPPPGQSSGTQIDWRIPLPA